MTNEISFPPTDSDLLRAKPGDSGNVILATSGSGSFDMLHIKPNSLRLQQEPLNQRSLKLEILSSQSRVYVTVDGTTVKFDCLKFG